MGVDEFSDYPIITQTFVESKDVDPQDLIREPFERGGHLFTFQRIAKEEAVEDLSIEYVKTITVPLSSTSASSAKVEMLSKVEAYIDYEGDGRSDDEIQAEQDLIQAAVDAGEEPPEPYTSDVWYTGRLYLNADSFVFNAVGTRTTSSNASITKTYNFPYNDGSQIPQTVLSNGATYYHASTSWAPSGIHPDTALPTGYTATCVYTRTNYSTTNQGYQATVSYEGTIEGTNIAEVKYVIIYEGSPIVPEEPEIDESEVAGEGVDGAVAEQANTKKGPLETLTSWFAGPEDGSEGSNMDQVLAVIYRLFAILVLAVLGFGTLFLVLFVFRKGFKAFKGSGVVIMARDELSGKERKIQTIRISQKRPVVNINYNKAPKARHFSIVIKPERAELLLGKEITINLATQVDTHVVGQSYNNLYIIPVEWYD